MAKSRILDINGEPFDIELDEQQTESNAKLAALHRHYGGHPSSGLTPPRLAEVMRAAEQGDLIRQCELAEDMEEKDGHIQSELGKRRLALQGVEWRIKPPPGASAQEQHDAEQIEALLRSATWLDDAIFDASDAILKGFACLELRWDYAEGEHYIDGADWRDPSWFQTHPERRNELRLRDGSYEGEALRPFGWVQHQARAKSGYLARRGLVRVLAWPFLFKNYSVRDLAEFLEIYGLPLRLGKYPEGATEREKLTLLRAVMGIGHNAGGIIPKGMDIEFQKAAEGGSDPFMAMMDWCERTQSKAILGGTLTSQADGKSSTNALGNVHNEVRQELRDADLKQLANTLTRDIVYPLYALNGKSYRSPRRIPRLEFDIAEPEDLEQYAQSLPRLVQMGMRIPLAWAHDKLQIPKADDKEPVLAMATAPTAALTAGPGPRPLAALSARGEPDPEPALDALERAVTPAQWEAVTAPLLEPLVAAIQEQGPEAALAELAGRYPTLNDEALTELLSRALFVADTWGRLNGGH
ncbi:hypothetical protein AN401_11675 [Zobellella denitrificans]|uniref:Portal protein n=1 Tax=Zobellella denitrificans TaxID=347534 RepID=A0A291HQU7_9GAMM|nr:DUF935 domain-containing protein [Zobellella denitrificans]ATG74431.1 hypothetical protein AN401_11675 [Zobellella denitrificans]